MKIQWRYFPFTQRTERAGQGRVFVVLCGCGKDDAVKLEQGVEGNEVGQRFSE